MVQRFLRLVRPAADSEQQHERVFVTRCGRLRAYAQKLTREGQSSADDLLQEAFLQFTIARPDLATIGNLDAYLTTLVRNLHVSHLRRTARQRRDIPIEEYDSADFALTLTDGEGRLLARDGLTRVAQYVCVRKDTSKAASILALRFFHGFYRLDIARIVGSEPRAVDRLLWQARNEARLFMTDRERFRCADPASARRLPPLPTLPASNDPVEIVAALRTAIFATARPPCPAMKDIARWYSAGGHPAFDASLLSHIVSCHTCLERIRLAAGVEGDGGDPDDPGERLPDTAHGKWTCAAPDLRSRGQRRKRNLLEHRPKELRVSVNGLPIGELAVEAARNRVRWTLRPDEPLAFAELHSEQGARMALLNIAPVPEGDLLQRLRVELSDSRSIELSIDLSDSRPAVRVEYIDPSLSPAPFETDVATSQLRLPRMLGSDAPARAAASRTWWSWIQIPRLLRFVPITLVLLTGVTALSWWKSGHDLTALNPATLLERAVAADSRNVVSEQRVIHRTLRFEVRRADSGAVQTTHRIDAWRQGGTGRRAVRIFDRGGHLVGGRWTDAGGRENTLALSIFDDVWQAELSPQTFRERYAQGSQCVAAARADAIDVTCKRPPRRGLLSAIYPHVLALAAPTPVTEPSSATLTLRRVDLHATRLMLTVRAGAVDELVTVDEQAIENISTSHASPDVFSPPSIQRPLGGFSGVGPARARTTVSPSLELRALELLDRLAVRDYVSIERTAAHDLLVKGLVGSVHQKRALLDGVAGLNAGDAVKTDLRTFAEAASLDSRDRSGRAAERSRAELRTLPTGPAPIEQYLRGEMPAASTTIVLPELTRRVLGESRVVRREASALASLLERFPEDLATSLDAGGRAAWQALAVRHAAECLRGLTALDQALAPYFPPDETAPVLVTETLAAAIPRLSAAAITIDDLINRAFTASDDGGASNGAVAVDVRSHVQRARSDAQAAARLLRP